MDKMLVSIYIIDIIGLFWTPVAER